MVCARCKTPIEETATAGGWDPHLCPNELRSHAFDRFLNWVAGVVADIHALRPLDIDAVAEHTVYLYRRMPPWERGLAIVILVHAGIEPGIVEV